MSNFSILLDRFKKRFPNQYQSKIDIIEKFVTDYIEKRNINVKFLNSCSVGFKGVRTRDQVILRDAMINKKMMLYDTIPKEYIENYGHIRN